LKSGKEKKQITYKGKPIKITADFSMEILKARRAWNEVFLALNENKFNPGSRKCGIYTQWNFMQP
jgi:hypothetical protein